jgi:hypothetical protein
MGRYRPCSSTAGRRLIVGLLMLIALLGGIGLYRGIERGGGSLMIADDSRPLKRPGASAPTKFDPFLIDVVRKAGPRQTANFSLLRTPPELLPEKVMHIMRRHVYGMNWGLAQLSPVTKLGKFWVIPGNGFLCVLWHSAMDGVLRQSCAPTSIALAHGVAIVTLSAHPKQLIPVGNRLMIGIAPDRAEEVLVHTGDSSTVRPVSARGVFMLNDSAANPPDLLTFR